MILLADRCLGKNLYSQFDPMPVTFYAETSSDCFIKSEINFTKIFRESGVYS